MQYTRLFFIFLYILLSGCSSSIYTEDTALPAHSIDSTSTSGSLTKYDLENYKRALYAIKDKNYVYAINLLNNVSAKFPYLAGPLANLGIIYYQQKKYELALGYLKRALTLNPKNASVHNIIASVYQSLGDLKLTEKHLLKAINYKPDYANAYYNLALLYDVYFQDIQKSLIYYKQYSKILKAGGHTDKITNDWVRQLQYSIKKG